MPWTPTHVEKISDYPVRLLRVENGAVIFDDIYQVHHGAFSSLSQAIFKKGFKEIKELKPRKKKPTIVLKLNF
jgi:hypothetical protein